MTRRRISQRIPNAGPNAGPNSRTAWQPPRGIRYEHAPARPRPFVLRWTLPNGTTKSRSFPSASAREMAARDMAAALRLEGTRILDLPAHSVRTWTLFAEATDGRDPLEVAREWADMRRILGRDRAEVLTISQAARRFLDLRQADPARSRDGWLHLQLHLRRFVAAFGERRLGDVSRDDVRAWLAQITSSRGGGLASATTRHHHLVSVRTFYQHARAEMWTQVDPCSAITVQRRQEADVYVIPPADAARYFDANAGRPFVARLALEAFGGVRCSTAARITAADVDLAARGIRMPGRVHKSGRTRYRQGQPPNVWAWLAAATPATWAMTPRQYAEEKRLGWIRAGMDPGGDRARLAQLRNVWRHSFVSHHLAAFRTPQLTSYLAQHSNLRTTEIYEGTSTAAAALAYFAITPSAPATSGDPAPATDAAA